VLPTKKFPELKLMINGEYRNQNNTLSSDDDSFNVSGSLFELSVSADKEVPTKDARRNVPELPGHANAVPSAWNGWYSQPKP
jgi:hypothetical protein